MNDDIMNKSMVIYRITNNLNGKAYVGQTTRMLKDRMYGHLCKDLYIDLAIRKHGIKNFTVDVLEQCHSDRRIATEKCGGSQTRLSRPRNLSKTFGRSTAALRARRRTAKSCGVSHGKSKTARSLRKNLGNYD